VHDLSLRGLAIGSAIVLGGVLASLAIARLFARPVEIAPPLHPVLQTAPRDDFASFRREKQWQLESYGRIDRSHQHIPIEEAMRRLAKDR